MKRTVGKLRQFIAIYIVVTILAIGLLLLVSKIPQSMLSDNWAEDRNTDLGSNVFHLLEEGNYATLVDDYTDNLKIDIAYRLNEQSIFVPSAYTSSYDFTQDYGRYWHGYCILLRPLLLFLNLNQLRILYGVILIIALFALLAVLMRKKQYVAVLSLAAAVYICNFYMTTKSLMYFSCTFLALIASALILHNQSIYRKWKCLYFFAIGMLINYFDFLSFETLTLSLPLFFAEIENEETLAKRILNIVKCLASWGMGYVLMFSTKWLLYISVNKSDAVEVLKFKLMQRIGGADSADSYSFGETLKLTLSCLKGISFSNYAAVCIGLLAVFLIALVVRKFHKSKELDNGIVLFLIGIIPLIRFFVVREHSSSHFYFTYYALFTTTISISYIAGSLIIYAKKHLWRKL